MNSSSSRNRDHLLARIATRISEWVRQEIVDDDPWDDEANRPEALPPVREGTRPNRLTRSDR